MWNPLSKTLLTFQEKKMLDIKNIVTEMKNFLNAFMNGLDTAKGRVISFTPQTETQGIQHRRIPAKHICGCLCAQILKRVLRPKSSGLH